MKHIALSFILTAVLFCSCGSNTTKRVITAEMAYEGVSNYCHNTYDWSIAKDNPSIMYVQMGEETDSVYQVVFRSYTAWPWRDTDVKNARHHLIRHDNPELSNNSIYYIK